MSPRPPHDSDARRDRGELSLGAVITATARLGAGQKDVELIVDVLGLALRELATTPTPRFRVTPYQPIIEPREPAANESPPAPTAAPVAARLRLEEQVDRSERPDEPDWLRGLDPLPFGETRLARATPEPPLEPIQARAAMALVAATRRPGRRLDIDALIDRAARCRPQMPPPLLHEMRTVPSVEVLVDASESMEPYAADTAFLVDAFADVTGRDRIVEHVFLGTPLRGVDPDPFDGTTTRLAAPAPRSLVLVISDLGVGGRTRGRDRGMAREWQRFAAWVAEHEGALRILTPFAERRPAGLDGVAHVIAWEDAVDLVSIRV